MPGPNEIDIYIGERMRKIREFRGIGRDLVAAALGMTSTRVGLLERGLRRASAEQVVAISGVLRIRPSFFFGNTPIRADDEHASAIVPSAPNFMGKLTDAMLAETLVFDRGRPN
jgi:transcriptional regulator with XRE-family HTH domain